MFDYDKERKRFDNALKRVRKLKLNEIEKKSLLILGASVLFVLALVSLISINSGATPLQKCNGVILSQQKYQCLAILAENTQNATVCGYINSNTQRYSCIASIAEKQRSLTT